MKYLLLLLGLLFATLALSQEDVFLSANKALSEENFPKAIEEYSSLLRDGYSHNPDLYHNLGLAYLKSDSLAQAILYFEKALKNEPGHAASEQNLVYANKRLDSLYLDVKDIFLIRWWRAFCLLFSANFWAILSLMFLLLAVVAFVSKKLNISPVANYYSLPLIIGLLLACIISIAAGSQRKGYAMAEDTAIIMTDAMLKSGPDTRSEDKAELAKGEKVWIIDQIDDWSKVSIRNKQFGWVKRSNYMVI